MNLADPIVRNATQSTGDAPMTHEKNSQHYQDKLLAMASKFVIQRYDPQTGQREIAVERVQGFGPDRWAIREDSTWVYSKPDNEFIWEPRPSERDDAFTKDCRFEDMNEAILTACRIVCDDPKHKERAALLALQAGLTSAPPEFVTAYRLQFPKEQAP